MGPPHFSHQHKAYNGCLATLIIYKPVAQYSGRALE